MIWIVIYSVDSVIHLLNNTSLLINSFFHVAVAVSIIIATRISAIYSFYTKMLQLNSLIFETSNGNENWFENQVVRLNRG